MDTQKIVILGAGFAGLQAAHTLQKHMPPGARITLVDAQPLHVYTPDLYEVATAENPEGALHSRMLCSTVAMPVRGLIDTRRVRFVQARVRRIVPEKRVVECEGKTLAYEYLVVALGSQTQYFGVPGLEKYALPLKTLEDALQIQRKLRSFLSRQRQLRIVVGGGGATGVETAAELMQYLRKLNFPAEVQLIEAGTRLMNLSARNSSLVKKRLVHLGVGVQMGTRIAEVLKGKVRVQSKQGAGEISFDMMIWTGGVKVSEVVAESLGDAEARGAIVVDRYLRSVRYPEIFAAGDNACFLDAAGKPLPMLAQIAFLQGKLLAKNLRRTVMGRALKPFSPRVPVYVIPAGGRYAMVSLQGRLLSGSWAWYLRRLVDLQYLISLLPWHKALVQWWKSNRVFMRNDL